MFISTTGDLLPRWETAFAGAVGHALADADGIAARLAAGEPRLVWVRLAPGVSAAEQVAALPEAVRQLPFVVLSDVPQDEEALAVFNLGARGYANSHAVPVVLRRIATVVRDGGVWIGESLMQRLLRATSSLAAAGIAGLPAAAPAPIEVPRPAAPGRMAAATAVRTEGDTAVAVREQPAGAAPAGAAKPAWEGRLTGREREVALHVARGESNKEVARALGVSERTVKAHLGAVLEKLRVRDRLQLSLLVNGQAPLLASR